MILGLQQAFPGAVVYMWSRNNVPTQDEILKPSVLRGIYSAGALFSLIVSPLYPFTYSHFPYFSALFLSRFSLHIFLLQMTFAAFPPPSPQGERFFPVM